MKIAVALPSRPAEALSRIASYTQLIRPRMGLLVLATVAAGGVLAAGGNPDWSALTQTAGATALLFAGASALNQLIERHSDALMSRTADRPLPAGLLQPREALVLGCALAGCGIAALLAADHPVAGVIGGVAFVLSVWVYRAIR